MNLPAAKGRPQKRGTEHEEARLKKTTELWGVLRHDGGKKNGRENVSKGQPTPTKDRKEKTQNPCVHKSLWHKTWREKKKEAGQSKKNSMAPTRREGVLSQGSRVAVRGGNRSPKKAKGGGKTQFRPKE